MPVDPAGTKPGLTTPPALTPKTVDIACRRPTCSGKRALIIASPQQGGRSLFQCTECHHTWGVATGGAIDF